MSNSCSLKNINNMADVKNLDGSQKFITHNYVANAAPVEYYAQIGRVIHKAKSTGHGNIAGKKAPT